MHVYPIGCSRSMYNFRCVSGIHSLLLVVLCVNKSLCATCAKMFIMAGCEYYNTHNIVINIP